MIQKLNGPRGSTAIAPYRPPPDATTTVDSKDGLSLQSWGSWRDGRHYRLEVIQQPIRARMCGFGDKDRRPLAPATVAQLVVHDENDNLIDDTDIDYSFFVVTADLWSADGKVELNLVQHPTPSDRHAAAHALKKRRTGAAHPGLTAPDPTQSDRAVAPDISPGGGRPIHDGSDRAFGSLAIPSLPTLPSLALSHPYESSSSFPPLDTSPLSATFASSSSFGPAVWSSYNMPPPPQPLLDAFTVHPRTIPLERGEDWSTDDPEPSPYRTWSTDPAYGPLAPLNPAPTTASSSRRPPSPSYTPTSPAPLRSIELSEAPPDAWPSSSSPPPPPPASATEPSTPSGPQNPPYDQSMYAPATGSIKRPLPGHAYTRTLVGPLVANACRLFDQHRNPGVFFLFQDLSIRTEGTFRLRLRLMNIGAPAPPTEGGMPAVLTGNTPILAQTYTDAFDVYSAKRFPGVPDTTALSIAFGNQGQKLPLRNRHGSRKDGRRRRRGDDYDSDEDSDGP